MNHELKEYVVNGGPIVGVTGMTFLGYPVADWAYAAAFLWTVVQIGLSIYDRVQKYKAKKYGRE